jgi:hypothetical protein
MYAMTNGVCELAIKCFKYCKSAVHLTCARCVCWYQEATERRGKHIVVAYFKVLSEDLRWMTIKQTEEGRAKIRERVGGRRK